MIHITKKQSLVLLLVGAFLVVAGGSTFFLVRFLSARSADPASGNARDRKDTAMYDDYTAPPGSAEKITDDAEWVILIDPGHGFSDTGAESDLLGGATEADINLAVGLALAEVLEEKGIRVIMTREEGSGYDPDTDTPTPQARTALANRRDIDLYLSIHCDSFPTNGDVCGIREYYCLNDSYDDATKMLASKLDAALATVSAAEPIMKPMPEDDAYYVVRYVDVPSVLVELGFISNAGDAGNMINPDWQAAAAMSLYRGIEAYIADASH